MRKAQIPAPIYAENCNHKRQKISHCWLGRCRVDVELDWGIAMNSEVVEKPEGYPLELSENLHIHLWAENGEYKWTIAMWIRGKEGYSLEFIGGRPLDKRVKWKAFKKLIKQGQKLADKKFDAEHI